MRKKKFIRVKNWPSSTWPATYVRTYVRVRVRARNIEPNYDLGIQYRYHDQTNQQLPTKVTYNTRTHRHRGLTLLQMDTDIKTTSVKQSKYNLLNIVYSLHESVFGSYKDSPKNLQSKRNHFFLHKSVFGSY